MMDCQCCFHMSIGIVIPRRLCHQQCECVQVTLKHISHYWMYYEAALQPWVHYVPVGKYDAKDILPVSTFSQPSD